VKPATAVAGVLLLSGTIGALPTALGAVAIRHDRSDADALKLGARFPAVGRVYPDGSCTLVSPVWAATAAHVAASLPRDAEVEFGARRYLVTRVVLHPEGRGPAGTPPEVDLALLELAESPAGVSPLPIYRRQFEQGRAITIVGYGDFGTPRTGFSRSDGRRRAVTNVVDDAGPRRLFAVFDAPPAGSDLEGVGGPGDSGGPAILEDEGGAWLAGVSSASMNGKPGQYGVTDVFVRISTYARWIDEVIGAPRAGAATRDRAPVRDSL
jgi:hypothetical protein